jgi:hypothetical protein
MTRVVDELHFERILPKRFDHGTHLAGKQAASGYVDGQSHDIEHIILCLMTTISR